MSDSTSDSPMVLAGVVGKLALPFSAVGVPEVLGEGLGVPVPSWPSTDSTGVVGFSGAAEKGGALPSTGGVDNPYTELAMPGRNRGSVKTLDT